FGLTIPEKYGGAGLPKSVYSRVFEEICTIDASIAVMLGAHGSIGTNPLILFGTEKQKEQYLPRLASGELIGCFGLTEPGAGSDAAGIQSFAQLNEKKTHFILNGSKIWISNGGIAGLCTVFAKTEVAEAGERKKKITAFLVESKWPGFSSGKQEHKLGIRGSNTTSLNFDNVEVPVDHILGPIGKGFKVAMETLNLGRLSLAAGCVGGCKALIKSSVEYARDRRQFGQPIIEFEIIQDKISQDVADTYAAESMVYLTSALADRGHVDYSLESAICKIFASETLWRTVNDTVQIAGGLGYSQEYPYERFLRDARINLIFEGTNEILRAFIALAGMQGPGEYLKRIGKALRDPIKGFGLLTEFAVSKVKDVVAKDSLKNIDSRLKDEADRFNEFTAELESLVEKSLMKYGKEIIHHEFILARIANMAIDLYGMAAVISRVDSMIKAGESVDRDLPVAKLYCDGAWRRVRREARQVENNLDDMRREIVKTVHELNKYPFEVLNL
ncbi:MAG: acyl-CoA dehydrogenase, partial [Calditrichaeota bacterium]